MTELIGKINVEVAGELVQQLNAPNYSRRTLGFSS